MSTHLITGEESWLETPCGREWSRQHKRAPDGYRWAPKEVGDDLEHAHRILSASGRVGPRAYGGSWFGEAGGGASHRATEWTWAEEVSAWPARYLLRKHPHELDAVSLHIRKASGERLTDPERKAMASRTHRDRKHRGFVVIAAGLMRHGVRNTRPGDGIVDDAIAPPPPADPSPKDWHAEGAEPVTIRLDYSPEEHGQLVRWLAGAVLEGIASGEGRTDALNRIVTIQVADEYQSAPDCLRTELSRARREGELRLAVTRAVLAALRERASA